MVNELLLLFFFLKEIIIRIYEKNFKFFFGIIVSWYWEGCFEYVLLFNGELFK